MKDELDKKLCADYPALYRQRNLPMDQTCMCWGFPGDGWYTLINELSRQLTEYATENKITIEVAQVKEKFGTLSFYIDGVPKRHYDEVNSLIGVAEAASAKICERCGKPGKVAGTGWLKCLCPKCRADGRKK
jgi:hypothetical protein